MLRFTLIVALAFAAGAQNSKDAPPPPQKPAWHVPMRTAEHLDCFGSLIQKDGRPVGIHIACQDLREKRIAETKELAFPEEFGRPASVTINLGDDIQQWGITRYIGRIHWAVIGSDGQRANGDL